MTFNPENGEALNVVFRRLRKLDRDLEDAGLNKNERVDTLINACITEGLDNGVRIVGAITKLGFTRRHVGIQLKTGLRRDPEWPFWGQRADGTYYAPARELPDVPVMQLPTS